MFKEKIQKIYEHCRQNGLRGVEKKIDEIVMESLSGEVHESVLARRLQDVLDENGIMSKSLQIITETEHVKSVTDLKRFIQRYRKISPSVFESFRQIIEDSTTLVGNTRIFDSLSMKKINQGISLIEESYKKKINESLEFSSVNIEEGELFFDDYIDFEFYFSEDYVSRNSEIFSSLVEFFQQENASISLVVGHGDTETGFMVDIIINGEVEDIATLEKLIRDYHETYTEVIIVEDEEDGEFLNDLILADVEPGKYTVVESNHKYITEFDEIVVIDNTGDSVLCVVSGKNIKVHKDDARRIVVISDQEMEEIFECHNLHEIVNAEMSLRERLHDKLFDNSSIKNTIDRMKFGGEAYRFENGSVLRYVDGDFVLEFIDEFGDTCHEVKSYDFVYLTALLGLHPATKKFGVDRITISTTAGKHINLDAFYNNALRCIEDSYLCEEFIIDFDRAVQDYGTHKNEEMLIEEMIRIALDYGACDALDGNLEDDAVIFADIDKKILREEVITRLREIVPESYEVFDAIIDEEAVQEFCSFTTSEWFIEQDIDNYISFVISFLEKRGLDLSMYR